MKSLTTAIAYGFVTGLVLASVVGTAIEYAADEGFAAVRACAKSLASANENFPPVD